MTFSCRQITSRPCIPCGVDRIHYGLNCSECGLPTQPSVTLWQRKAAKQRQALTIQQAKGAKAGGLGKAMATRLAKRLGGAT